MVRITERDRLLIGFLATARYLTSQQITRLVFPGRADSTVSERLNLLAEASDPRACLRRLQYRTYEGKIVVVWALSKIGYHLAEGILGRELKVPRQDIGADFLEHSTNCSQLFVYLAQKQSRTESAELPTRFRWWSSEGQGYPYGEYDIAHGQRRNRLLQPDAVLEVPQARRRFFIEMEMGTHPIASGREERQGATLAKADRYEKFIRGFAGMSGEKTYYADSFPEPMHPEVLFVVTSEKRRDNVNEALAGWRKELNGQTAAMRALKLTDASHELRQLTGAPPRITEERPIRPPPAAQVQPSEPPLLTAEEFQILSRCHNGFIDIVHRQHDLHRQLSKAGKAPQFPFDPYPKDTNHAGEILDRLWRRFAQR
jgi:Replication-relaxation